MARFKKMAVAGSAPRCVEASSPSRLAAEATERSAYTVARDSVRELPALPPSENDRRAALLRQRVGADDAEVGRAAVEAAAMLRCQVPFSTADQDRKVVGHVARFLVWSSYGGVVDPVRAFTKANVDEHLAATLSRSQRSLEQRRYVLYTVGRRLHPHQFPAGVTKRAPISQRHHPVASHTDIRRLQTVIPRLPTRLGQRAQALLDLCYGAGARPADLRTLRATAITSDMVGGRAIPVVSLPNLGGRVRQVPVLDPVIGARLLGTAATLGDKLVLAPHATVAERNVVNRVSEQLRHHGHASIDATALRNRWILDMAEKVPAVLLQQLADLCELRILVDERTRIQQYKLRHAITILEEAHR